ARTPSRSESRGASISGVEPSLREMTGSPGSRERRSRYRWISGSAITEGSEKQADRGKQGGRRGERTFLCVTRGGRPMTPRCAGLQEPSNELLFDNADGSRRHPQHVKPVDRLERFGEDRLEAFVDDHHQTRLLAGAALDDALDRNALVAQHGGDPGEDPGAIGDLEVQVEGRGDVGDDRQLDPRVVD